MEMENCISINAKITYELCCCTEYKWNHDLPFTLCILLNDSYECQERFSNGSLKQFL